MDHMMPIMDGMEATKIIRETGYEAPIVALSANAVTGQMDIFLENGFTDFISKPIDVRQLNFVLNKMIRDKQPPEVIEAARQQAENDREISSDVNLSQITDTQYAEFFLRDAKKTLNELESIMAKGGPHSKEDMQTYVIHTHGIKSALANIGKTDLSAAAFRLEKMGHEKKIDQILSETVPFIDALKEIIEELTPIEMVVYDMEDDDPTRLRENLIAIIAACEDYDERTADKLIESLRKETWSRPTAEMLDKLHEQLFISEFEGIVDTAKEFLEKLD
jgi:CheY-like chemotaxis protein